MDDDVRTDLFEVTKSTNTLAPARVAPTLDGVVGAAAAMAIGSHIALAGPITLTLVVSAALLPVWLPLALHMKAKIIPILGIGAILNGLLLNALMATTREISVSVTLAQIALILEILFGLGTLVWVKHVIGPGQMALFFSLGILISQVLHGLSTENAWKLDLSLPVTAGVLAVCWARRAYRAEMVSLLGLAMVSALNDSRSAASILATTFLILGWQRLRSSLRMKSTALRVMLGVVVIGLISFLLMQTFILDGFFGQETQARSEAQITAAGSILLGGRPEVGATVALLRASPGGYGIGVIPNFGDIYTAKSGMRAINYDPNNGYVEKYMFGDSIEVHSAIGDLWLRCGLLGLAFALVMVLAVIRGSALWLADDRGRALMTFLAMQVAWDAFFSPFYVTAAQVLTLALALLAVRVAPNPGDATEKFVRT